MMKRIVLATCALPILMAIAADPQGCGGPDGQDNSESTSTGATSEDPNEMKGPLGTGEERYVQTGEWMNYTIYFENKTNATAAAQEVFVELPMDANLDWSTLELGEVAFGEHLDMGLSGKRHGVSMFALPGSARSVRTEVRIEDGRVKWYLRDWDPSTTDNFPEDPRAGFLPPNDPETHCGEGRLSYRVRVKDDAPKGSIIRASAQIVFDSNPMIETDPAWWNTVAQMKGVKVTVDGVETTLDLIVGQPYGELPDPGTPPEGHSFGGWFTQPDGKGRRITADSLVEPGDEGLYQYWQKSGDPEPPPVDSVVTNTITYLGVEGVVNTNVATFTTNDLPLALGPVEREGYEFLGWTPNGGVIPSGTTSNVTFTAQWKTLGSEPEPKVVPAIFDSFVAGAVGEKGATYNGFLGEETLGGTFTFVVKKPKKGETTASATLTKVNPATGKKEKVTGAVDVATGFGAGGLAGLQLNEKGVGGKLGDLAVQGAVDAAKAKDSSALAALDGFNKQVYGLVFADAAGEVAYLTATFSTKGKVKVAGSYRGAKVSGSAVMSVGDRCAVPFVWSKKGVAVTFVLWFDKATRALVGVTGLGAGAVIVDAGLAGGPAATYPFALDEAAVRASVPDAIAENFLPISIAFDGKKFDAGKAAKVSYKGGVLAVDTSKGDNVTGLKLSYAKGALKGSFTVYAVTGGKLVKNKFAVAGVMVDGVGHAVGTNKKLKPIPVEVTK